MQLYWATYMSAIGLFQRTKEYYSSDRRNEAPTFIIAFMIALVLNALLAPKRLVTFNVKRREHFCLEIQVRLHCAKSQKWL